ncbi:MAG: hypothetical protein WCY15_03100 [Phenylobacterium sp.]|uniref:hypothetical protein n=1 Tax=Phenylobacterium sp. TaxID=1871053 RepID=UPI002A367007|nr:hypothetical protein [Phenylobacterium sp.]MDX9998145.1 hypothetical protein [Phenylobacterium sp.]
MNPGRLASRGTAFVDAAGREARGAEVEVDPTVTEPTELFVPSAWYGAGAEVVCDDPTVETSREGDLIRVRSRRPGRLRLAQR